MCVKKEPDTRLYSPRLKLHY
uniref:Uncharacterized protein n=1 Tax=Anguilla anguilla TaxID=7936 RepID=A0A0E9U1S3_ANGAN